MRAELYGKVKARLESLCINEAGEYYVLQDKDGNVDENIDDELHQRAVRHIDLWNHNVEFLEQEAAWGRPAVFIEFVPFKWQAIVPGVEYRAEPLINLHIVTDWTDHEDNIGQFGLLDEIHSLLAGMCGQSFMEFDIESSSTNHNHEDIVENIETYTCVGFRHFDKKY